MRRSTIAAILSLAVLSVAGCKTQQQRQQEDLANIQARYNVADQKYTKLCLAPMTGHSEAGVNAAITGDKTPSTRPPASSLNTPECKTARAEMDTLGDQLMGAQAKAAAH
jgi:hypothetical protein